MDMSNALRTRIFQPGLNSKTPFAVCLYVMIYKWKPLLNKSCEILKMRRQKNMAIIKLSLVYSFRRMFFIGQNLKHVHMAYSFLELLIFCLEFISPHTKEILYVNTNFIGNQSWNTNHELFLILMLKKPVFFNVKLKLLFFLFYIHDSQDSREGGGYLFNSSLPLPPAPDSQTLRH